MLVYFIHLRLKIADAPSFPYTAFAGFPEFRSPFLIFLYHDLIICLYTKNPVTKKLQFFNQWGHQSVIIYLSIATGYSYILLPTLLSLIPLDRHLSSGGPFRHPFPLGEVQVSGPSYWSLGFSFVRGEKNHGNRWFSGGVYKIDAFFGNISPPTTRCFWKIPGWIIISSVGSTWIHPKRWGRNKDGLAWLAGFWTYFLEIDL